MKAPPPTPSTKEAIIIIIIIIRCLIARVGTLVSFVDHGNLCNYMQFLMLVK
jgi:hypothetical protein